MLELVRDVSHGKGLSVVVSSHLLPDIEKTCDSVVVMRRGEVVKQGPIAALKQTKGVQFDVELRLFSDGFVSAMGARGASLVHQLGSSCRFDLPETETHPHRLIFDAAIVSGAQVRGFRPAERSLEDVFMEAVSE